MFHMSFISKLTNHICPQNHSPDDICIRGCGFLIGVLLYLCVPPGTAYRLCGPERVAQWMHSVMVFMAITV